MQRLVQGHSAIQRTQDSLAALSSPRQYLEFALNNSKMTRAQVSETATSFMRRFGEYAPETFFANVGYDELVVMLGQAANNWNKSKR